MSQPFLGQVQSFGFGFAPRGWMLCNGQTLPIQQYTALFSLLGTMYGGNGTTTFQLPNLQSRVPMHYGTFAGSTYVQGETGGEELVSLTLQTMPGHTHTFFGSSANAGAATPAPGQVLAKASPPPTTPDFFYGADAAPQSLNAASITTVGGNLPHENLQPYLAINWCIAFVGIYPSRS
jgi:microcystin-dependent protein